jgi:hypothetical protein
MDNNMFTNLVVKITSELASLNTYMKTALDKLADHEKRLDDLEKGKGASFKDDVVKWLVRGLVASIFVIGTLTGAGTILQKIFAQ